MGGTPPHVSCLPIGPCTDLEDDIDGLDCSQFDKAKSQPAESKANNPFTP